MSKSQELSKRKAAGLAKDQFTRIISPKKKYHKKRERKSNRINPKEYND